MKKIALFYTTWTESVERIAGKDKARIIPIHYSQIVWRADKDKIEASFKGQPLSEFSLFFFRSVGDNNETLPLLLECAKENKIRVVDKYLLELGGAMRKKKSTEAILLLKAGIAYPLTIFFGDNQSAKDYIEKMTKPAILKSISGRHGVGTFLIKENTDLEKVFCGRGKLKFLIQEYIPNDGDYRLFLVGNKVIAGFKRQPKESKLVLNASIGQSLHLNKVPSVIAEEAEKATEVLGIEIAGVDLVIDQRTGKTVVIEVNQAPEFTIMEKRSGIDIAQAIVDYLLRSCR